MRTTLLAGVLPALATLLSACSYVQTPADQQRAPIADHVFTNGYIYTVNEAQPVARAVATKGDTIVYVGDSQGAQAFIGDNTELHDLAGKMMLPGFHDVHIHPLGIVQLDICDFKSEPMSLVQMVPFLQDCIARYEIPEGEWLVVPQWSFAEGNQPSADYPTLRAALDAASSKHPILIRGNDGHHAAANSLALANAEDEHGNRVGISKQTLKAVFSGYRELVGVDAQGEPSGGLTESAIALTGAPGFFDAVKGRDIMPEVARILAQSGITSIQDAATDPEHLPLYQTLEDRGKMTFRVRAALIKGFDRGVHAKPKLKDIDATVAEFAQLREAYRNSRYIRADGAKIFIDGVIEGNPLAEPPTLPNAAVLHEYQQPVFELDSDSAQVMLKGYVDMDSALCRAVRADRSRYDGGEAVAAFKQANGYHPHQCLKSRGVLEHDEIFIQRYIAALDKAGFTVHAHAIGDRAVRTAVDAFAQARQNNGDNGLCHAIGHAQLIHPDDQQRIGEQRLCVTFTHAWSHPEPAYEMTVAPFVDKLENDLTDLYNTEHYYMGNVYPARSIQQLGGIVTAGSDAPVDSRDPRPFVNIQQAVTRADADLTGNKVLNAAERLDIHSVIAAYTLNGAKALNQSQRLGSIETGKKADLIVLDQNIVDLATQGRASKISDTRVLLTLFDGNVVYRESAVKSNK